MSALATDIEIFRAEIARLVASPQFASSRQFQEFLRYTSEKAFAGETHLEQADVASAVLGRGSDFNPIEDAAVRKLASQVRQRLEQYYAGAGDSTDVIVSLPVRSYIPRFERRIPQAVIAAPPKPAPKPGHRALAMVAAASVVVVLTLYFMIATRGSAPASDHLEGSLDLWTAKGDITQSSNDAPGSAVRLGPALRDWDEISARLDFTPNREAQQAGLIVWQDGSHFIRLGRKFFGRNQIEFLLEEGRASFTTAENTVYDPEGQSGRPLWLSIRRRGNTYRAYLSRDGIRWELHGTPIVPQEPFARPRAGVYAFNGRRDAPSIRAAFDHIATGWTFDRSDDLHAAEQAGWSMAANCANSTRAALEGSVLRVEISSGPGNCSYGIARPLGSGDWQISTLVDAFPLPGRSSGLRVQGTKASVRVVRYFLNGPAISFINDARTLVGKPDLNGSPAIILRLSARSGKLFASYSANGADFVNLPVNLKIEDLGTNLMAGIRFGTTTTDREEPSSTARFYYYRESVQQLVPYRSAQ